MDILGLIKNEDFGNWSPEKKSGYMTALAEIKLEIASLKADKQTRWALIQELMDVDIKESVKEIIQKRK